MVHLFTGAVELGQGGLALLDAGGAGGGGHGLGGTGRQLGQAPGELGGVDDRGLDLGVVGDGDGGRLVDAVEQQVGDDGRWPLSLVPFPLLPLPLNCAGSSDHGAGSSAQVAGSGVNGT